MLQGCVTAGKILLLLRLWCYQPLALQARGRWMGWVCRSLRRRPSARRAPHPRASALHSIGRSGIRGKILRNGNSLRNRKGCGGENGGGIFFFRESGNFLEGGGVRELRSGEGPPNTLPTYPPSGNWPPINYGCFYSSYRECRGCYRKEDRAGQGRRGKEEEGMQKKRRD